MDLSERPSLTPSPLPEGEGCSAAQPSLVYAPHPLLAAADRRVEYVPFIAGESIAQYLGRIGVNLGYQPVLLRLNDELIPEEQWALTIPRTGDLITIRALVRGDGGGDKNPLATVAMIAVIIAAPYAAPYLAPYVGGSLAVASAAIMIGGNLIISSIFRPPQPNLSLANGRLASDSPTYSLEGGQNRARPYEPMALTFGIVRQYADLGAKYYTEFEGDDQYLYAIFHFGLADLVLADFKIGDTPLDSFAGVTMQVSGDDGKITLFPGNVDTLAGGALTHAGGWVQKTSSADTVQLAIEITGSLFYAGDAGLVARSCWLQMEYCPTGTAAWAPFAYGTQTQYFANYWSAGRYEPNGENPPIWVQVNYGSTTAGEHVADEVYSSYTYGDEVTGYNVWRWRPYSEINGGVGGGTLTDAAPVQGYQVQVAQVEISSDSRDPLRRTFKIGVPRGQYDVRVLRVTDDETDPRAVSELVWSQLRSYQPDDADYTGQKRVGLKIKASGQLQGVIDQFNAMAYARVRGTYGYGTWQTIPDPNPAWCILAFARGKKINGRRAWGCCMADSKIDIANLTAFAAWCSSKSLTFNGVFDRSMNCLDILNAIAACGRGSITMASGKLGVVWDASGQPVVATFGMANIRRGTFQVRYITEKVADEIVVHFNNPDLGYKQDEVRAPVPGVADPVNASVIEYFGCANQTMAQHQANLWAAEQKYRRKQITFDVDFEGLVVNRGDVAIVSHEMFAALSSKAWGYSGRLLAGTTTVLTLDRAITMKAAVTNYCGVRFPDGTLYVQAVQYTADEVSQVTLTAPLPSAPNADADGHPPIDYLWFFGLDATGPAYKVKIANIDPRSQSEITLTCVPEDPAYYAQETNPGGYTPPATLDSVVNNLVLSNLGISETRIRVGNGWALQLVLTWDTSGPYDHADVRAGVNGGPLQAVGTTYGRRHQFTVPQGAEVSIEVIGMRPLFGPDAESRLAALYAVEGQTATPTDPVDFAATGEVMQNVLTWSWGDAPDYSCIEIWASATNDRGTATLIARPPYPEMRYTHLGLGVGVTVYYWARTRDTNQFENFSGWVTASATTVRDPSVVLDLLQRSVTLQQLVADLATPISLMPSALQSEAIASIQNSLETFDLTTRMQWQEAVTNATVTVDPVTGRIQLLATADVTTDVEARLTAVEIEMDADHATLTGTVSTVETLGSDVTTAQGQIAALESSVALTATEVYVDDAVANGIGAITVAGVNAYGDLAEAAIQDALDVFQGKEDTRTLEAQVAIAQEEISATATALEAEAQSRAQLVATVADAAAAIVSEQTARANADTAEATARLALAARVTTAETNVTTNATAIANEATTRANADTAEANARTALDARVTTAEGNVATNTAAIANEATARANADTAEANARVALEARVTTAEGDIDANAAAISDEVTARADADSAEATARGLISARLDTGDYAAVKTPSQASADAIEGIHAKWMVKLDVNGHVVGIELADGSDSGEFIVLADKLLWLMPDGSGAPKQIMVAGNVNGVPTLGFNGNLVVDGTIVTNAIVANGVTVPVAAFTGGTVWTPGGWFKAQTVSITTSGGPVVIIASLIVNSNGVYSQNPFMQFNRDNVVAWTMALEDWAGGTRYYLTCAGVCMDTPDPGTHTYDLYVLTAAGQGVLNRSMFVMELKR